MNGFLLVAVKLLIGFIALIMIINVTGKGNLAPSTASDQVQNYVLGGIIGGVIYNEAISLLTYMVLFFRWIKTYNVKAKQILDGKARIIIDNGRLNVENCKKARLSAHDVAFKLRTHNIYSTRVVKRAVVEQNGQLITDGQLLSEILDVIGRDEDWLHEEMKKQGYQEYSEIFLGEYTDGTLVFTPYHSESVNTNQTEI